MAAGHKKRWVIWLVLAILIIALGNIVFWSLLAADWTEIATLPRTEAARVFADGLARAGGGPAYVLIDATGAVEVRRDLEGETPAALETIHLLLWEPRGERLVQVDFPYWFVRMKVTDTLNFGTFTTTLAGDWQNLDLRITENDLERRGPGLVLDHARPDGTRIMLWSE